MFCNIDIDKCLALLKYDPSYSLIFSSGMFLIMFSLFSLFYIFMARKVTLRVVYLILFSLYFYYKCSGFYFLLLILISVTDYIIGNQLYKQESPTKRKLLLTLSLVIDLGILIYFKYTNFFIDIVNNFQEKEMGLQDIFLPIGISFFTFQSLSYIVDIYRKRLEPVYCWLDYLFYVSFFPQLVAGPIVRARDFIPQIRKNPIFISKAIYSEAMILIIIGLFKKAVISDFISVNFVDRIFDNPLLYTGFENLMAVYGYTLQIYCDFSGYSDMAIGIALLLGFRFNKNFDSPYKSATITEFWRRWHISLSSWLKDYLYVSLGGNRKGNIRTYANLMITMLLGGLWHGASFNFIIWGAIHGFALGIHKAVMHIFPSFKAQGQDMPNKFRRALGVILTFNIVAFSWIFFRSENIDMAFSILDNIFTSFKGSVFLQFIEGYRGVLVLIIIGYIFHFVPDKIVKWIKDRAAMMPMVVIIFTLTLLIWFVMQIKSSDIQPFIYFQF